MRGNEDPRSTSDSGVDESGKRRPEIRSPTPRAVNPYDGRGLDFHP